MKVRAVLCAGPSMVVVEKDGMHYYRQRGKPDQPVPYSRENQHVFLFSARWKWDMTRVLGPDGAESPEIPDDCFPTLRHDRLPSGETVYILEAMDAPGRTEKLVVQRVLELCQAELGRLRGGWLSRWLMGDAPSVAFARQLTDLDDRAHLSGSICGLWRITSTEIEPLPLESTIPAARRRGRYYDQGSFDFAISAELDNVVVAWQVGPRFGSGCRYRIVHGGNVELRFAEALWKS